MLELEQQRFVSMVVGIFSATTRVVPFRLEAEPDGAGQGGRGVLRSTPSLEDVVKASIADDDATKIPVELSVRVRRTFELDNVKQQFGCNLHILMSWPTDEEEIPAEMARPAAAGRQWEPAWKPRFIIKNVMEFLNSSELYTIERNPKV